MPKASKKTIDKLYSIAYDKIMDARIKIARLQAVTTDENILKSVDDILFKLSTDCPASIINYFKNDQQNG